jgi:hypothetical protein
VTALTAPHWADLIKVRLGYGRDRARTIGFLQEQLGVSRRIVEKAIEQLRLEGCPVCTGSAGAWLTTDAAELRAHAGALRSRAARIFRGADALEATAARHERAQQTTLPWQEVA